MAGVETRRLDDTQLRKVELVLDDPLDVEGLTDDRPNTVFAPVIIAEYHLPKEKEVRCCYCEQRQHHQHGFVVEFVPMKRHLIGGTCGMAKLNLQFRAARSGHKDLKSRQACLRRLDFAVDSLTAIVAECDAVLRSDALREVEEVGKALNKNGGDLVFRLRAMGGALYEDVRVRDLAAETVEDERDGRRRFRNERRLIGQLRGRGVLNAGDLRQRVQSLKVALRAVASLQRSETDKLKTSTLMKTLRDLDDAHDGANAAIEGINRAPAFFLPENIKMLVRWAESNSSVTVRADGETLRLNGVVIPPLQAKSPLPLVGPVRP